MNPWALVLRGVLAFILGLLLVLWPGATLEIILVLFPIFVIIDGLSAIIIGTQTAKEGRWLSFIPMGILEILIGLMVLIWPNLTIEAFVLIMALWAFALGLGEFFLAVGDRVLSAGLRWLYALGGIITVILGICVIIYPLVTSLAVLWLFGIFFLVYGVLEFGTGLWLTVKTTE